MNENGKELKAFDCAEHIQRHVQDDLKKAYSTIEVMASLYGEFGARFVFLIKASKPKDNVKLFSRILIGEELLQRKKWRRSFVSRAKQEYAKHCHITTRKSAS